MAGSRVDCDIRVLSTDYGLCKNDVVQASWNRGVQMLRSNRHVGM
jgi:hypothetical protein